MLYLGLKTLHMIGWSLWIGGMVLALTALSRGVPAKGALLDTTRAVTGIGIALAWLGGLSIAWLGGWYLDGWFVAKLGFVLLLSGLHGAVLARMRRDAPLPLGPGILGAIHIAALALVIWIALVKPF